ncbi:glycoprotein 60 [Cryptosporidium bovis]|uniref:glycoprotein 60 n=1 Tax=Cryptosporidium bovis TaxID=310047 RepID=UPI00351A921D|nr:glycoprotein 60 [Cryptosporidium bovis]
MNALCIGSHFTAPSVPLRGSLSTPQSVNSRSASPESEPAPVGDEEESTEAHEGAGQQSTTSSEGQQSTTSSGQQNQNQSQSQQEHQAGTEAGNSAGVSSTQNTGGDGHTSGSSDSNHDSSTGATGHTPSTDAATQVQGAGGDDHSTSTDSTSQPTSSGSESTETENSGTGGTTGSVTTDDAHVNGDAAGNNSNGNTGVSGGHGDTEPNSGGNGQETSSTSTSSPTSGSTSQEGPTTAAAVCGEKFIIWFSGGVPVTTVDCGVYTGIYYPTAGGSSGGPKYISGPVSTVEVTNDVIKINGKELSTIPVNPGTTGENGAEGEGDGEGDGESGKGEEGEEAEEVVAKSRSRRSLQDEEAVTQIADAYSFPAGGKTLTVKLPKEADAKKREKYMLADDRGDIIFEGNKKEEFNFNDKGDLLDSQNHVILEGGGTSSAFGLRYIIPSISAFILSILLF